MHNREDVVALCRALLAPAFVVREALPCPINRACDALLDSLPRRGQRDEVIEHHHDVAVEQVLNLEHLCGREEMFAAVNVALEHDSVLDIAHILREAEGLETAAVGQEAMGKIAESMQPAELRNPLGARAQVEVVGVGKDNACAKIAHIQRIERLDARLRANGHENGRLYRAVRRLERQRALAQRGRGIERDTHGLPRF